MIYKITYNRKNQTELIGEFLLDQRKAVKIADQIVKAIGEGRVNLFRKRAAADDYKWWMECGLWHNTCK